MTFFDFLAILGAVFALLFFGCFLLFLAGHVGRD